MTSCVGRVQATAIVTKTTEYASGELKAEGIGEQTSARKGVTFTITFNYYVTRTCSGNS